MEVNGMAHVILTVSDLQASLPFYEKLLPFLGMKPVIDTSEMFYCVGGRTALGIMQADEKYRGEKFIQRRVGLHHLCFRARPRGHRCGASIAARIRREDRPSARGRPLGAGVLLGAV